MAQRIAALDDELEALVARYPDRRNAVTAKPTLSVAVDPRLAGFSAWYEMFPRSAGDGDIVRSPLVWLGRADPGASLDATGEDRV